jgi:4-phosphopantoate--beta-alanine ligase
LTKEHQISPRHPRAESLKIREELIKHHNTEAVSQAGLIAHGRGEAFDYLLGEKTAEPALEAMRSAAATLLIAEHPVISVNGNSAALVASDMVKLSNVTEAKLEVNLFHRSVKRERAIEMVLKEAGAKEILGVGGAATEKIPEIGSERRRVDPKGIMIADVVLIPLEDGDRAEALVQMGKKVIAIDLNPLSRTSQFANITIVDNIVRAMPTLIRFAEKLKTEGMDKLKEILSNFDNSRNLGKMIELINRRLSKLSESGIYLTLGD